MEGKQRYMEKFDVIILDSGLDKSLSEIKHEEIYGMTISKGENGFYVNSGEYNDLIGHGTAIFSIIRHHNKKIKILNIKIFDKEPVVEEDKLIFALDYIYENIDTNVINMSLGLPMPFHKSELQSIIDKLFQKGVWMVSAFDNSGCISYPAAYKNVIGVITHKGCKKNDDYFVIENSPINICAKGGLQRVRWLNNSYISTGGNSYACAHFTGILSQIVDNKKGNTVIKEQIKKEALGIYSYSEPVEEKSFDVRLFNKAAILPFNKEMHSLIRFEELLDFEIVDVYDSKYTLRVGASTNTLLNIDNKKDHIIKNLDDIEWDTFDSIIVGHLGEISQKANKSLCRKIIEDAIMHNKLIYSFDNPQIYNDYKNLYYPTIKFRYCNEANMGKLFKINKPVLCIAGTSSKQGKFSLQLEIRRQMTKMGYKIGQLGTEPSSLLFGMDECFHFGYNSQYDLSDDEFVMYVNGLVNNIADSECDLIISGCQSQTLHSDIDCTENLVFAQLKFLVGLQPDAVVLVVNPYDDIDYINKTIMLLNSFVDADVIGLVLFPMNYKNKNSGIYGGKIKLSQKQVDDICKEMNAIFDLPVYSLDNIGDLIENIIEYFQ